MSKKEKINVSAIYNYDQILLGNEKRLAPYFIEEKNAHGNNDTKENAICILRYVIEDLLRWTPKMMVDYFNKEVIDKMKLETVIRALNKYFPVQLDKKKDYYWYAHLLYPDVIVLNDEDLTIKTYRDVLSGKLKKFPKGFLDGDGGEDRIRLCLLYYLEQDPFLTGSLNPPENAEDSDLMTIKELYSCFAREGNKKLKQIKLDHGRRDHFQHAIDFLHVSLPSKQRNDFYYHYYKFKVYNQASKAENSKRGRRRKSDKAAIEQLEELES